METTPAQLVEEFDQVDASTPGAARHAVLGLARQRIRSAETLDAIALCVSEAVSNVVVHAYRDHPEAGCASVDACFEGSTFRVVVRDQGVGMLPRHDSPGLGLGLPLIAGLTDQFSIRSRPNGGTEILMRFRAG